MPLCTLLSSRQVCPDTSCRHILRLGFFLTVTHSALIVLFNLKAVFSPPPSTAETDIIVGGLYSDFLFGNAVFLLSYLLKKKFCFINIIFCVPY